MDFTQIEVDNITHLPEIIKEVVTMILSTLTEVASALKDFYTTLVEMKDLIFGLVVDPSSGAGLPVPEAIGLVRYLVGDVIFHIIYIVVLIGCLATIYKLVCLLVEGWNAIKEQVSAGSYSGNALANIISKFIK